MSPPVLVRTMMGPPGLGDGDGSRGETVTVPNVNCRFAWRHDIRQQRAGTEMRPRDVSGDVP